LRWVSLALVTLVAACGGVAGWLGAFHKVTIVERPIGPFTFVYRELPDANPSDIGRVTDDLVAELSAAGVTGLRPLGVYKPDGSAQIGLAVGDGDDKLKSLADVKVRELVAERGMVAEFPWRMPLSFVVSYLRVNPAFERYREEKGYEIEPAWVLLDGHTIVNMMPIARRGDSASR